MKQPPLTHITLQVKHFNHTETLIARALELAEFMRHSGLTSDNHQYMTYEAMDALMERQNALLGEVLDMLGHARRQAEGAV